MSKIKKLAGETALYGLGSIVPKSLNFLLVFLHTRIFAPEEYGVVTNLLAYVAFLNILYTFGMETAYFRFATRPGADARKVFNLAQTTVVFLSTVLSTLLIVFAAPIATQIHIGSHPEFVRWLALILFIDSVVAIPFAKLRLEKRPLKFALAKIINILIVIGLNLYYLKLNYDPSIGVGFVFLATLIANAFYLFFFVRDFLSWRPAFDSQISAAMFSYAYPVMIMGLAAMTNEMFSRLTLDWWLPPNFYGDNSQAYALGVFGACYKYGVLMTIAIQAFRFAAEPFFFSNAADKNSPELFAKVNHYFVIACCLLLLGVSINMNIFQFIIGKQYMDGISIVPILLLANLFLGMYYNFSVWFKVTDKTYYGTIITVGGALLTIVLNYLLIPIGGYTGSSWATLLVYGLMALTCYALGQKNYPIPYRLVADLSYIVVTVLLVFLVSRFSPLSLPISVAFHTGVILGWLALTYLIETRWMTWPKL